MTDEADLIRRVTEGDSSAFSEIYYEHYDRIYDLVLGYVKDSGDAEDLTQEIFTKVWLHIGKFRGDSELHTWMYRIAVNHCKNWLNKKRLPGQLYDDVDFETEDTIDISTPEACMEAVQAQDMFSEVIDNLPSHLHECFYKRHILKMPYTQISEEVGCAVGTAKSRVHAARKIVMANYKEYNDGE